MMDGLISNEAFINNADSNSRSSSSSSNDPLGVLLEAPLGAYRRLKSSRVCLGVSGLLLIVHYLT